MSNVITDPNDPNYDPALDPGFQDRLQDAIDVERDNIDRDNIGAPPTAATLPVDKETNYAGTGMTPAELVEMYGTNPDGSPRTEPAPDGPSCPPVSPDGYPFDTTAIPAGCNEPLTAECAAYYNELYKPSDASVGSFAKK